MTTQLAEPKVPVTVANNGIQFRTLDDIWRFAIAVSKSGLAPKGIQTPEAITVTIQFGLEVGLTAMAALQNIAPINGRPSLWGDAQLALVRTTGELEEFSEWFEQGGKRLARNPVTYTDDTMAVCRVKRRGCEPVETSFSVVDAKHAKLWNKDGPWTTYPGRMLKFRARSFALRDSFGDALRGLRSAEELLDENPIRTANGREVSDAGTVAASNPLRPTAPTLEMESAPDAPPIEGAPEVPLPAGNPASEETGRNVVDEQNERTRLSNEIREVIKEAEITLPRFEGMARKAGFMEPGEALSGGKLGLEKLRIVHASRRKIAGLEPAEEPTAAIANREEAPW